MTPLKLKSFSTFLIPLMLAFLSLLLVPVGLLLIYVWILQVRENEMNPLYLFLFAGCGFIIGYLCFLQVAKAFRQRFRVMITGIRTMMDGDRKMLQSTMPISSTDEFGQLGLAFNDLQKYIAGQYAEVERELQLAFVVQQNLLPQNEHSIAGFHIAALCRQTKEVGGDFYDIVSLNEGKFAIIVGDVVGKGLQAALLMTVVMSLFRREIRVGGTAGDVLVRLNRQLFQALQGQLFITAGLAIFDRNESTLTYANAGHMPPYLLREGRLAEEIHPSLPLGIIAEATYQSHIIDYPQGTRFVMYTDGMVESQREDGEMIGFESFERYLLELSEGKLLEQAEALMERISVSIDRRREDDRTVVIVER
ncbi:MAG: hypothetical protein K0Q73_6097 [Paenibacillus sp.]|jgi:serine phosphatase RsbU (regulator of sigma subunit)|nr:hypothetical protein [Paenibacillus sp.]